MPEHRIPDPPAPSPRDDVRTVLVGTVLWGVAFVALLPFWSWLDDTGRLWWLPTCASGAGLGLIGLVYTRRRAAAIERDEAAAGDSPDGPSRTGA